MYVRVSQRANKSGQVVRYLQLAHNEWDAAAGVSRTKIIHSFGREDELDRAAIERLVASLTRLLGVEATAAASAPEGMVFTDARPMGGAYVLDGLWRRLGIGAVIRGVLGARRCDPERVERILFGLVANRALAPSSKLAATDWIENDVRIDGLSTVGDDACYRAMDALLGVEAKVCKEIYHQVADLLNLEVDLLFFDTTSTYFETNGGQADEPVARDEHGRVNPDPDAAPTEQVRDVGFRTHGKSKDHRPDLPQVVIGMAVTRTGIPVRVWCWPGNTGDQALIRQVKDEMHEWTLGRVVWVADRGFSSAENRRYLRRAGGHYIIGEKLRSGSPDAQAALARRGRYAVLAANLQVKEVKLDDADDRFVVCYNPDTAQRDRVVREHLVAQLEETIAGSDDLGQTKRAHLRGVISTKPGLNRFLRVTGGGLLRVDHAAIKTEERLDGKYLLRSSDPKLSTEDIALGYKQLLEVERGWRDMKSVLDLRPVYHRLEDRIRAHVLLCWLALLLVRVAETTTDRTWPTIRAELQRLHAITYTSSVGTAVQTTEPTKTQRDLLTALAIDAPKRILELTAATDAEPTSL
jgi:Transposase DDE domain